METIEISIERLRAAYKNSTPEMKRFLEYTFGEKCFSEKEEAEAETEKSKPYRCPVCDGKGHVPSNFYNVYGNVSTGITEVCRTCKGQGIIWNINK